MSEGGIWPNRNSGDETASTNKPKTVLGILDLGDPVSFEGIAD